MTQRFRDRRLNDLRSAARPTRSTGTDPSVPIRPRIPTPVQRVTRISAETDDLAKSGSAAVRRIINDNVFQHVNLSVRNSGGRAAFVSQPNVERYDDKILAAAAVLLKSGIAFGSLRNRTRQRLLRAATGDQTVAPEATGAPIRQPTAGQAPNVSKKMGSEMDSGGDPRPSPDEQ
jgi:hypothetical protein